MISEITRKLLLFAAAAVCLISCHPRGDEAILSEKIESLRLGIQERRPGEVMEHLHPLYQDHAGRNKKTVRQFMIAHFLRKETILIVVQDARHRQVPEGYRSTFIANMAGVERWFPGRMGRYRVIMEWRKQDDEWLVYRAEWEKMNIGEN